MQDMYLQLHPRSQFKDESKFWSEQEDQEWQCCSNPFWKVSLTFQKSFSQPKKRGCLFHSHFKKKRISLFKKGYLNHRKKAFLHNKKRFSREKKVIKKKKRNAFLQTVY